MLFCCCFAIFVGVFLHFWPYPHGQCALATFCSFLLPPDLPSSSICFILFLHQNIHFPLFEKLLPPHFAAHPLVQMRNPLNSPLSELCQCHPSIYISPPPSEIFTITHKIFHAICFDRLRLHFRFHSLLLAQSLSFLQLVPAAGINFLSQLSSFILLHPP